MLYLAKETYESAYEADPATAAAVGRHFLVRYMLKMVAYAFIIFCVSKT